MNKYFVMVKKLLQNATIPSKASIGSAGLDVYSAHDYVVLPKEKTLILTDISMEIPSGYYGHLAPRSGLALKHFIDVGAGVIDSDYTGNIGVLLFNFSDNEYIVKKEDRVAQLIFEKIGMNQDLLEIMDLNTTERGDSGFGSTGN